MILCELYDYIEIACMHHLEIRLTLKDGSKWKGFAQDTARNEKKEECIKITQSETGEVKLILLDELISMEAITENPHFQNIDFSTGSAIKEK